MGDEDSRSVSELTRSDLSQTKPPSTLQHIHMQPADTTMQSIADDVDWKEIHDIFETMPSLSGDDTSDQTTQAIRFGMAGSKQMILISLLSQTTQAIRFGMAGSKQMMLISLLSQTTQ